MAKSNPVSRACHRRAYNIFAMRQKFPADPLICVPSPVLEPRYTLDRHSGKMETAHFIQYCHVEWRRRRALLLVPTHMKVVVVCTPVCEAMN